MSNIFIIYILLKFIKEKLYNFLNCYCIKDNNYLCMNKEIYKKYEYNNNIDDFNSFMKKYYRKSKQYFFERENNYSNFTSILRHICKLLIIPYYKKISYNKNTYSIEYYINKESFKS